ncbi:MAG: ABC transporter ATP-binding protein, partial [Clostridia bacterium]|nr:ABC transporter ATP-binding protein [Clostridia bacterium]
MLSLIDVTKTYTTGNEDVKALKGVSMSFRKSEFVSVLGPSGCGKTTLLNIIGGLDRYTSGDLVINGVSTKNYKDGDWDAYRNHSVGFVFQSYNLIPHQTVIKNVELALTLSGIGKEERRRRAKEALERVGLADQINKKPNQLSGGQMQRVAIARAIVNDPEIILADEPTGALDSETSVQIMEILKELSSNRLIVMVTHNGELAKEYSTRIISLSDGLVIGDTDPYTENGEESEAEANETQGEKKPKKQKKPSMSFLTALSLSLNNLFTKKARTILTAFAGSIGIIGIALILSLSAGFNSYIGDVQRDTLSNYPLTINKSNLDTTAMIGLLADGGEDKDLPSFPDSNEITSQDLIENLLVNVNSLMSENNLVKFKEYLDENADPEIINAIRYAYNLNLSVFFDSPDDEEPLRSVSPVVLPNFNDVAGDAFSYLRSYYMLFEQFIRARGLASELLDNARLLDSQYEVLAGNWPE